MKLSDLIQGGPEISRRQQGLDMEREIGSVRSDSRLVESGDLFVALKGEYHDGHRYIRQALERGAAALLLEDETYCQPGEPWLLTRDSRESFGFMAQKMAGRPSLAMSVIGITGTNGKTTVAHMLARILEEAGKKVALFGTVENRIGRRRLETGLTTQDIPQLAEFFKQAAAEKSDYVVMEVSSHALALSRTAGIEFDLAIFTNLTQDHLDFHHTFHEYLSQKAKLFAGLKTGGEKRRNKAAILNLDDSACAFLGDYCQVPVITYGTGGLAHVQAQEIRLSPAGTAYRLVYGESGQEISLSLFGRFNVSNSLAAVAAALVEGVDIRVIRRTLAKMEPVRGRFQRVRETGTSLQFSVFVDYAHTPDGLENCLSAARELCPGPGRVICVFGAGGHRDTGKRPLMGEAAARLADIALVTSDNPRDEEPDAIIRDICKGMAGPTARARVLTEPDRRLAIGQAIDLAEAGDVVLICGKGHEDYQIIGSKSVHLDDYEEAGLALERRAAGAGTGVGIAADADTCGGAPADAGSVGRPGPAAPTRGG